jgi:formylglycine-generating enzyme required for sulfatase activity
MRRGAAARGRELVDDLGWIEVPSGIVQRGTPTDEIDEVVARHADLTLPRLYFAKEAPRTAIRIEAFVVLRVPVTVEAWNLFAADTGRVPSDGSPTHPIDERPWRDAVAFCQWYSDTASDPVRLPTEVEWERAARGDDVREFPWGDSFDPRRGNLVEASLHRTCPVGSFPTGASPFGLLDMAGNVDEWTATPYAPYPGAPADVPKLESWALDPHITRGGSWRHHRDLARCARRHGVYPGGLGAGFRLVRKP